MNAVLGSLTKSLSYWDIYKDMMVLKGWSPRTHPDVQTCPRVTYRARLS